VSNAILPGQRALVPRFKGSTSMILGRSRVMLTTLSDASGVAPQLASLFSASGEDAIEVRDWSCV
jgi:nicotinate-nucleotide pyrophosphorylase